LNWWNLFLHRRTGEALGNNAEELRRDLVRTDEAGVSKETAWRNAFGRNGFVFPYQDDSAKNAYSNSTLEKLGREGGGVENRKQPRPLYAAITKN
jgi:hypothetical protein